MSVRHLIFSIYLLFVLVIGLVWVFGGFEARFLRSYGIISYIAQGGIVLLLVLLVLQMKGKIRDPEVPFYGYSATPVILLSLTTVTPFAAFLNVGLDLAPAQDVAMLVVEKRSQIAGTKFRRMRYTADFIANLPDRENLSLKVSKAEYEAIEPGWSCVSLTIHQGFFGFPWISRTQIIHPAGTGHSYRMLGAQSYSDLPDNPGQAERLGCLPDWSSRITPGG